MAIGEPFYRVTYETGRVDLFYDYNFLKDIDWDIYMGLDWGCRILCDEPGCDNSLTEWSPMGTPCIPLMGYHNSGYHRGWFLHWRGPRGRSFYRPISYKDGHAVYCPQHAHKAIRWLNDYSAWKSAKATSFHKIFNDYKPTLKERVSGFLNPESIDEEKKKRRRMLEAEWLTKNPPPRPPWDLS